MPRFHTHLVISIAAGSAYSLAIQTHRQKLNPTLPQEINPLHVAACAIAAAIGGCAPDIFEPASRAVGPNHRCTMHSVAAGAFSIKGAHVLATSQTASQNERWILDVLGAFYSGYFAHLAADATTAKSLGLLHRNF